MKKRPLTKSVQGYFKKKFQDKSFAKAYEQMDPLLEIAMTISKARNEAGLSQIELAKKLKTTQSVISRIEHGNQNLSVNMLARIAAILGCDLSVSLKPHKMAA